MTEHPYLTFQKYSDLGAATEFCDLLKQNNIDFILDDTSTAFEPAFSNNELTKEYRVKLKKDGFDKADKLLLQISSRQLDTVDKDYYLFDFSDEELIEVVTKPDEWNQFDYLLAQKILKDRGKEIRPELAETIRRQRIEELARPEDSQKGWILFGYVTVFLGGLIGIFIGWHLLSHKKTLPTGDRVYAHSITDRKHGSKIFIIGLIFFIFWVTVRIVTFYNY